MLLNVQIYLMTAMQQMLARATLDELTNKLKDVWTAVKTPVQTIGTIIFGFMILFYIIKAISGNEQDVQASIKRAKVSIVCLVVLWMVSVILNFIVDAVGGTGVTF